MKKTLSGLVFAIVLTSAAQATTFNVTRMDDPGPDGCVVNDCSLREAVIAADQTVVKDIIVLPAGIYLIDLAGSDLSELVGDLDISSDMEFVGASSTIDGQELSRIMDIRADASVILRDLTLQTPTIVSMVVRSRSLMSQKRSSGTGLNPVYSTPDSAFHSDLPFA